jgi:hypothetical protein
MDDNTIKLDLCYLHNEVFTDINCLYNLFIVNNKQELTKAKALEEKNTGQSLRDEIKELERNKEIVLKP